MLKEMSVVMLPTDNTSIIGININIGKLILAKDCGYQVFHKGGNMQPQHLYFLSNEEIIVTTDKSLTITVIEGNNGKISKYFPEPSQEFIEKYIKRYNKHNPITKVIVEYEECQTYIDDACNHRFHCCEQPLKLRVNPKDNTVLIKEY